MRKNFYSLFILFSFFIYQVKSQTCGVWTATNTTELTSAVTAACGAGGGLIKVATGTYTINNPITICSNLTIEGGYNATFTTKSSTLGATTIFRSTSNPEGGANQQRLVAIYANTAANFWFQDITIQTANATSNGMSAYGVHITNSSSYTFTRTQVIAGNSASGTNGSSGANGFSGAGGAGGGAGANDNENGEGAGGSGGNGGGGGSGGGGAGGFLGGCCSNGDPGNNGGNPTNSRAGGGGGGGGSGGQEERPGGNGGTGGSFIGGNPCGGGGGGSFNDCSKGGNGGNACSGAGGSNGG
ncbi:hypothetical protein JYU20_00885, partial [Bacteroidales bacterium AH-315-I05]|nr:hypothetical protein [Bacteroidales bacterium AH-315-I05]